MNPTQRLFSELDKQGKTTASLADHIGVAANAVTSWKSRNDVPPSKYIVAICEFLGVSSDYLLSGKEGFASLSKEQEELLTIWGKLDNEGKTIVKAKAIEELRRLEQK